MQPTPSIYEPVTDSRRRRLAATPQRKQAERQARIEDNLHILRKLLHVRAILLAWRQPRPDYATREQIVLLQMRLRVPALAPFSVTTGKRTRHRLAKAAQKR